ncbi:tetratricopeptide repeat protein [Fundidesulfovibrio agrisoli]|uniref:tetratricopeptide repeat protein n=1 Tax=Fundidesulfovibrio agrisoli TaxID=2922717 RepID=UPI001FAD03E6|nr:tetratricopeptide repeat protein [Fundidesulfovibrio agrisoli]
MPRLSQLVDQLPQMAHPRLAAPGIGVWLVWEGQLSTIVGQIFNDFGGFLQAEEDHQSLWFFFGDESIKALGRLSGFARVNRLPLLIQLFPASLLIGYKFERSFTCAEEFLNQEANPPQDLEMLVHPAFEALVRPLPGMNLKPAPPVPGLSATQYGQLTADIALAQDSPLGWYFMLRPLGDPLDKNSAEGWRSIFSELQSLLERIAAKYISNEGYLIFGVDNVRSFRNVVRELLTLEENIRSAESGRKYWPCVMACTLKLGQHLNKDLPRRINLDWADISPDYPHMSFRSALYLGPGFRVNDVRRTSSTPSIDDWCSISLVEEDGEPDIQDEVPFKPPANLLAGSLAPCFYCGLASHEPMDCPSKTLQEADPGVWDRLGLIDMAKLEEAGMGINQLIASEGPGALRGLLDAQDERETIVRGIFEIGYFNQLRCVDRIWRSTGKELPGGLDTLNAPTDGVYLWDALNLAKTGDHENFEQEITANLAAYGRGFQPRSVQGFVAMEQADWSRAGYFWQEAGRSAYTPLQRGWLYFLEARGFEVQGDYFAAAGLYRQARSECPRWLEPGYRLGVCLVKQGFTDRGMNEIADLLRLEPNIFNRVLIDPELERGRIHILSALKTPWSEAKAARDEKLDAVKCLPDYLKSWFREDHPFLQEGIRHAEELGGMCAISNYVCFICVVRQYEALQLDLRKAVEQATKALGKTLDSLHEELKAIHHEAAWFPFGKLLREFNKDYNSCAAKLNWMRTASMQVAANFRKSQDYVEEIESTITLLKARLVTLRIVRDSTLFVLLLGKSFMWLELVGMVLSLIAVPGIIFLSQKFGQAWIGDMLSSQKWQVQKGLIIIVSIVAMGLASVKTALTFEKKRAELFKEGEAREAKAAGGKGKGAAKSAPAKGSSKALPPSKGEAKGGKKK